MKKLAVVVFSTLFAAWIFADEPKAPPTQAASGLKDAGVKAANTNTGVVAPTKKSKKFNPYAVTLTATEKVALLKELRRHPSEKTAAKYNKIAQTLSQSVLEKNKLPAKMEIQKPTVGKAAPAGPKPPPSQKLLERP